MIKFDQSQNPAGSMSCLALLVRALTQLHSVYLYIVSITGTFCGNLVSQNVYHTKKVNEINIFAQSGNDVQQDEYELPPKPPIRTNYTSGGKDNWYVKKKDGKRRDKWKQKATQIREKFKPHYGFERYPEFFEQLTEISSLAGVELNDSTLRRVEGLVALFANLQSCASAQHFFSAVFLYVRDFYDQSITGQVLKYVQDVIQDGIMKPQSGSYDENWLNMVRNIHTNWTMVKSNRIFKQISKLIGILVTLGLCDAANMKFSIGGFKLIDEAIVDKHYSAFDFVDAIFGTVTYFVEGAYLCFKTRSITPLLLNDFSSLELETEYMNVLMWWDLVKNGNLDRVVGMSDSEFTNRLNMLIQRMTALLASVSGFDKKLVADKITKLKLISNELITLKISSGTRRSPFAIELYGDSSQGKTTFGDQLIDALLISSNLPVDKQYRAALNPGDKFFSNWTSDKLVAILDDMANERSTFVEKPPTRAIIDICNNQMYYAPKAELESKGKCFVEPEIVVVTTNKKDLDAYAYSNCPYSIQRRMDLVMTVKCKDEFQRIVDGKKCGVDSEAVRRFYTVDGEYTPPAIDDIWLITIEQAIKPERLEHAAGYAPLTWRGQVMVDVPAVVAIQCAIEYFSVHRTNQFALMEHMKKRVTTMKKCSVDGCMHLHGFCPDHVDKVAFEPHFGVQVAWSLWKLRNQAQRKFNMSVGGFMDKLDNMTTQALYKKTSSFIDRWDWLCLIPEETFDDVRFQNFLSWYYKDEIDRYVCNYTYTVWFIILLSSLFHMALPIVLFVLACAFGFVLKQSKLKHHYMKILKERNDSLPIVLKQTRDTYARLICTTCLTVAALYALCRVYKAWSKIKGAQGSLEPETQQEVDARDAEANVWAPVAKKSLPVTDESKATILSNLENKIDKCLLYASVKGQYGTMMANVLMIMSDVLILPDHYFDKDDTLEVTCRKRNAECIGGKFTTRLCKSSSVLVPGTDLRVCYTGSGGSFPDIRKFFPIGDICDHPFRIHWRKRDGDLLSGIGFANACVTSNGAKEFKGGEYLRMSINTFGGMCGAVVLSDTKAPCITGFHLGGASGTPKGCFGTLTINQLDRAVSELNKIDGVLLTGKGEKFEPQAFGMDIMLDKPLHPKSPLNFLPEDSQFEYYGSCLGGSTSRSDVRKTPISDCVAQVCGVDNIWGAPKMKPEWFGWQTCLANASVPGKCYPHELLVKAVKDYKRPLLVKASLQMWQTKPLSDFDNLNGIPGCKFIDSINLNTSMGYPLTGPKRKFVIEHEPTGDKPLNREFVQEVKDEIQRVYDFYARGERAFTIAKACKKDEILPVAKEKCRIFYGNPIALTFLIRRYFLPVIRFLQMNPLLSECAVGINSHGPEWHEFYTHVMKNGSERLFGGDYGKYDQKLPSQLLKAALRILIDLSEAMGYSQKDRDIMAAMSGDIVYSLVAVNGDLIGLVSGTHISGNSLTVVLNGIAGSLNLRAFFYSVYGEEHEFRNAASMMTYGDDNIGTVHKDYTKFNIRDCSKFLATYGQTYTMPDKESELKPYLSPDQFEFLKRVSVYHEKLNCHVGALLDKSIFKSLHCYMRPKGCEFTPKEACAINVDGALREWFNHGEEIYETRRVQMQQIAKEVGIDYMCDNLHVTYDQMAETWKEKYGEQRYSKQSGAEGYDDNLFTKALCDFTLRLIAMESVIACSTIGEVDLIFQTTVDGTNHLVLVEIKESILPGNRCKGKKQLRAMLVGFEAINSEVAYMGVLLTPKGYTVVGTSGAMGHWHHVRLPFEL